MVIHANGLGDEIMFRFAVLLDAAHPRDGVVQVDVSVDDLFRSWEDALDLLRTHGLDRFLPEQTRKCMGMKATPWGTRP